tara:strand:+ start:1758 stop:2141 length:384 start_codon:yes stop_codon:yes gene_type:complete
MKKETPEEFKDSLIQEIIKLKGLGESKSLLQHLMVLSEKEIPELLSLRRFLRIKNRETVKHKEDLLETELYIVINEETLNTLKGKEGKTAKFTTREQADSFASERLEMWSVSKIHFKHKWINHTPNY